MTPPENYGVAAFKFTLDSTDQEFVTTCGFHNTALADADTIAGEMVVAWDAAFTDDLLSNLYTFTSVYVIIGIGGVLQSAEAPANVVGTETGAPVSPAVAVGIKKQTSYAGKHYRGRMYLPAGYLAEAAVSSAGIITGGDVTALQTAIDNFKAFAAANDCPLYLLHEDPLIDPTPINAFIVRNSVRTQRRRQHL